MRRRECITLVGGVVLAWPLAARTQQLRMPVIGWLSSGLRETDDAVRLPAFRRGLDETGYTEGRNVAIEYRRAEGQLERLPALAADLVGRQVSLMRQTISRGPITKGRPLLATHHRRGSS